MATGVAAALAAQGLAGTVPVSGQDADVAALNRVALGTQLVSVWKDARAWAPQPVRLPCLGWWRHSCRRRGNGRVRLHEQGVRSRDRVDQHPPDPDPDHPGANLNEVVDANWITGEELCAGVTAGTVAPAPDRLRSEAN